MAIFTHVVARALLSIQLLSNTFKTIVFAFQYLISYKYRNLMGVIIWKVFTHDVVRFVGSPSYKEYISNLQKDR